MYHVRMCEDGEVISRPLLYGVSMAKLGREGAAYDKLKRAQRGKGLRCWICGNPIRYDLPTPHPLSFEYDHYYPVSRWRECGYQSARACALDPANGRSAHRICNAKRGDAMPGTPAWDRRLGIKPRANTPAPPGKRSRAT